MWRPSLSVSLRHLSTVSMVALLATVLSVGDGVAQPDISRVASSEATESFDAAEPDDTARRLERRRQRVGFSPGFSILYQDLEPLRSDLAGMYAMGARRIRVDLSWALVERERGHYDWSHTDRVFGEARAAGLTVLPILGYQPGWAGARRIDVAGFTDFVTAAVDRYADDVPAWEIWNEPNLERFWFGRPDPEGYGRLVSAASAVIRSHDPGARVVVGALAPAVDADDGSQISPETFLRRAGATWSPGDFDAVSVHAYSYPALPTDEFQWNTFFRLPGLLALAREIGGESVRLWVTEYGAPTGTSDRAVTEDRQARMLVRAVRAARQEPGIGPIYLYSFRDAEQDPGDPEANFGLIEHGGRAKPALQRLTSMLND